MQTNYPRICISSTGGGGGKTLLSIGLTRALIQAGVNAQPFKKGPDYIDAAWLSRAARRPASNLDPFFLSPDRLRAHFCAKMRQSEMRCPVAIIEGNRGLYDGLNETGQSSTAQMARALGAPVILCLDCAKSTRTMAALINGLVNFEKDIEFAGVVLNRVGSKRHEKSLLAAIAANTALPVLGCLPRLAENPLPERHMGLASQGGDIRPEHDSLLNDLAALVADHCDIPAIMRAAKSAPPIEFDPLPEFPTPEITHAPTIGVIRDEALWFYYPENIEALEKSGCRVRYLSLFDAWTDSQNAWQDLNGIYLGGGFPEDHAERISRSPYLNIIAEYAQNGMPIYAECGGLIILAQALQTGESSWKMAGVLPLRAQWTKSPQGLGYVEGRIIRPNPWYAVNTPIVAHEFHYSRCDAETPYDPVMELSRGSGLLRNNGINYDGICKGALWASYAHIFSPAMPQWARSFARLAALHASQKQAGA